MPIRAPGAHKQELNFTAKKWSFPKVQVLRLTLGHTATAPHQEPETASGTRYLRIKSSKIDEARAGQVPDVSMVNA